MKNVGKSHIAIGMLQGLRPFINKKGKQMAFAKIADYKGTIDTTFFSEAWEALKDKLEDGGIYALKGRVDGSRDQPSLIVESLEDPATLGERAIRELHIELENSFSSPGDISPLKDVLFGAQGNCNVFFHLTVGDTGYIIKGNAQMLAPGGKEFIEQVKDLPLVKAVWTE